MRKLIKQQLQEEIGLLEQANSILENPGEDVNSSQLLDLLAQEQELAISIGNRIEETEGAGTKAVALLEEYCEALWHLSEEFSGENGNACASERVSVNPLPEGSVGASESEGQEDGNMSLPAGRKELLARLEKLIGQVKAQIDELPRQYDVVFLPYKASMWDSLESIWMAAEQDPDCNCYVIPIPYCDLNPDGSIGQVHYEASLMPSYVPVTHYEAYDIKENRPDIIYIHNPYDNTNMVTRVAAEFYSEELKKHTDMLVYIPYYLGTQHLAEEHKLLSAYLHADKIILQNETMVEDVHSSIPREKLAALGSPKADRILRLEAEKGKVVGQMVPKAWKKKIKNKKVILYNVSISGILQFSEQALDKIRYVLSKFENREDVVLLWRPHPLIESTLKSMRPALYEEYMQIKRQFIADDYGILDETPDVGVSVVIADAYVGEDSSSLVNYFGVLGKPVFYTDWKVTEEWSEDERASVCFADCWFEDNSAWFVPKSDLGYQYLCKMDLETGRITLEEELPGEINNPGRGLSYSGIAKIGKSFVLAPARCGDIYIYYMDTQQALKIPIKGNDLKQPYFAMVHNFRGKAYLQPVNYPAVIEVDIDSGYCVYHEIPGYGELPEEGDIFLGYNSAIYENRLYIPYACKSAVLIFDLETGLYSEKTLGGEAGYSFLASIKNEIWLAGEKTAEIICWDIETDQINTWNQFPENFIGGDHPFTDIVECGEGVIVFPRTANMAVKIDRKTGTATQYHVQNKYAEDSERSAFYTGGSRYWMVKEYDGRIFALSMYDWSLIQHEMKLDSSSIHPCRLQGEDRKRLENLELDKRFQAGSAPNSYMEDKRYSVSVFINYLTENFYHYYKRAQKNYQNTAGNLDGRCGEKIHAYVKESF